MEEFLLVLHFLIVLFVVAGFPLGLIFNHRGFRYFHCGVFTLIILLMLLGIPCPLTVLEEIYGVFSYEGSFIATWLRRIIYLEWVEPRHVVIMDVVFSAIVYSSFFWHPIGQNKQKGIIHFFRKVLFRLLGRAL
jgi:hypothetical protein